MVGRQLQARLSRSLPFYYGWVIFAVSAVTSYSSRPMMAVATLSVFLVPMTEELGWSRGVFSGAVSLGGICAVAISPLVGWFIDRYGSSAAVAAGGAVSGACAVGLSLISNVWLFYALYVPGRMAFASPLELGTSTAISNWFIRRRAFALGLLNVTQGTGLALMPLLAHLIIMGWSWRIAWASLGAYTLAVAVVPGLLLLARRPEDMGLRADPAKGASLENVTASSATEAADDGPTEPPEPGFTLRQASATRAFWLLAVFSGAGFMVQAGVSLHQAPHYIQQGLSGTAAAVIVSTFAISQVPGGMLWALLARRVPVRFLLGLAGLIVGAGALGTLLSGSLAGGLGAASVLGVGVGGLHVLLRLAWADYYGRRYLGSIRGFTLPVQLAGQSLGPIIAGFFYDSTGRYDTPFIIFTVAVWVAALMVMAATPPAWHSVSPSET